MSESSSAVGPGFLDILESDDHLSIMLSGVIDARLREQASHIFATVMMRRMPVHIIARQAEFADAASWAFLVQIVHACNEDGIPVRLDIRDESVRTVLESLGLARAA